MKRIIWIVVICFLQFTASECQSVPVIQGKIQTGAEQPEQYLPLLRGKKVGLVANNTAIKGDIHLLDFLILEKINVVMVFAPEHGFRGEASAGEVISDGKDSKTGVGLVSLYGEKRKPTPDLLKNIDIMVFDIQDVGCRFYTYLSTLFSVIEACAENHVPLIVLDRPNPNGDYVAGPVLKPEFSSFVGIVRVPVVHGCTLGEMALMINGEKWTVANDPCQLTIIKVLNYTHSMVYVPPVPPSPNLPNYQAIRLYPSLCFFEATSVSIGRGTEFPFQVIGGTLPGLGSFQFTPRDIPGFVNNPINEGKICFGIDLRNLEPVPQFTFRYFLDFYKQYPTEKEFLTSESWLDRLSGSDQLIKDIREGKTEEEMISSWLPELKQYKETRKKYLLYPDFE
jgi:uncharacterized protein YbbC (DUF1343 family)